MKMTCLYTVCFNLFPAPSNETMKELTTVLNKHGCLLSHALVSAMEFFKTVFSVYCQQATSACLNLVPGLHFFSPSLLDWKLLKYLQFTYIFNTA